MRASRLLLLAAFLAATTAASASEMSYMFKRGDLYVVTGNINVDEIEPLSKRWTGDYLWVRKGGREYLIRDDATMSEARKAFAQVEIHQAEYDRLRKRMNPVERRHDDLERQVDAISDRFDEENDDLTLSEQRDLEQKLHELERKLEALEQELRTYEEKEEDLDRRQEELEQAAERKLEEIIDRAIAAGVAKRVP